MRFRDYVRGTIDWDELEAVALEFARRFERDSIRIEFLEADNWLSIPLVVDETWFVKIISPRHSLVHALFTAGRNAGAFSSGSVGFFDHVGSPLALAERELEATRHMREVSVNAPRPIDAFEVEGLGVLVLEYLDGFRTLSGVTAEDAANVAPALFDSLGRLHEERLAHGDLRAENVLVRNGDVYFIDATTLREDQGIEGARAYDLACALAVLEPLIGGPAAVEAALKSYSMSDLLDAREFLDFVQLRPDYEFDAALLKGEIEAVASRQ